MAHQQDPDIQAHLFDDDGRIPNNPELPLLIYPDVLLRPAALPSECERLFGKNGWGGSWRDGVFPYHHYHSTAHEVLGVVRGSARIAFGGEAGITVEVGMGDVVVIPAGVGHRNIGARRSRRTRRGYGTTKKPVSRFRRCRAACLRRIPGANKSESGEHRMQGITLPDSDFSPVRQG